MNSHVFCVPNIFIPTLLNDDWEGLDKDDRKYVHSFRSYLREVIGEVAGMSVRGRPYIAYKNDCHYPYGCEVVTLEVKTIE